MAAGFGPVLCKIYLPFCRRGTAKLRLSSYQQFIWSKRSFSVRSVLLNKSADEASNSLPTHRASEGTHLISPNFDNYRERYIPLTRHSTVSLLLQDEGLLTESERKEYEKFALSLDAVISTKYASSVEELKQLFDPINPDKDTVVQKQMSQHEQKEKEFWLLQRLNQMMEKANFHEVPDSELRQRLIHHETNEKVKVSVNLKSFDVLKFWVLGKKTSVVQRTFTDWFLSLLRIKKQPTQDDLTNTTYNRVISAVRLANNDKLTLKAFKDISSYDLEKLLPEYRISMGKFDRYMIITSVSLTSVGLLAKLVTVLAKLNANWTLMFSAATGVLGLQGYLTYKSRQSRYLSALNKMIYYKNVANNRGLITLVVDRAQDESFKEALLTYTMLLTSRSPQSAGMSVVSLENAVEEWICSKTGMTVEFDSADSIALLEQVGILSKNSAGPTTTLSVLPLDSVCKLLPQTPLSILSRAYESDVLEGYDVSKQYIAGKERSPNKSWYSSFVSRIRRR